MAFDFICTRVRAGFGPMEAARGGAPISAKNKTFTTTWDFCQLGPKGALRPISSPQGEVLHA